MHRLTYFKAYDIRGKLGKELNDDVGTHLLSRPGFAQQPIADISVLTKEYA